MGKNPSSCGAGRSVAVVALVGGPPRKASGLMWKAAVVGMASNRWIGCSARYVDWPGEGASRQVAYIVELSLLHGPVCGATPRYEVRRPQFSVGMCIVDKPFRQG